MRQKLSSDNRGIAHIALVAVIVVVVAAVGFAAYRVMNQEKDSDTSGGASTSESQSTEVPCESDDKDLCKFFTSWKASEKYRMSTKGDDGEAVFEVDGEKSRVKMTLNGNPYEVITIGKATYTKAGDKWYKQTIKDAEDDVAKDYKVDFDEPDESDETEDDSTYKKLGKEACGNLNCFKYEVIEKGSTGDKQYIWFDDKDYQLRRVQSVTKDGTTDMTFEYSNVTISEPSPVTELGENQYIVPGQSEPMSLPDMSQYQ